MSLMLCHTRKCYGVERHIEGCEYKKTLTYAVIASIKPHKPRGKNLYCVAFAVCSAANSPFGIVNSKRK